MFNKFSGLKKKFNTANNSKEAESLISLSYACTAFSVGVMFVIGLLIHNTNSSMYILNFGGLGLIAFILIALSVSFVNEKAASYDSSFPFVVFSYIYTTVVYGMIGSAIAVEYGKIFNWEVVIMASVLSIAIFIAAATYGHHCSIDLYNLGGLVLRCSLFSMIAGFIVMLFMIFGTGSQIDFMTLMYSYLSVPILILYIIFSSRMLSETASNALNFDAGGESSAVRKFRIALVVSSSFFLNIVTLFLNLLRILSKGSKK